MISGLVSFSALKRSHGSNNRFKTAQSKMSHNGHGKRNATRVNKASRRIEKGKNKRRRVATIYQRVRKEQRSSLLLKVPRSLEQTNIQMHALMSDLLQMKKLYSKTKVRKHRYQVVFVKLQLF